ncbi:MAG: HAMP domain-containing histidine kinase [Ignavibacteriae bacterium]|nr:HAMP domain-containing histidine kinase [Ignavibacteriota bacterium]
MRFYKSKISDIFYRFTYSKWQLKILLGVAAFGIFISMILYTQSLVAELISIEQKTVKFYTDIYKRYSDPNSFEDYLFLIDNITPTLSFPIIITDKNDDPIYPYDQYTINVHIDTSMTMEEQKQFLLKTISKMRETYEPIIIEGPDGKLLQKFYYSHSFLIDKLRFFPFVEILIVITFIIIGYIAFSTIRRNEESKVWVGMAKEAAHQLGTPISSLMAWMEIIRLNKDKPETLIDTINEMESDINRLNIIATRFSKIGSKPEKFSKNLAEVIEQICTYFEKRLPHIGKQIEIVRNLDKSIGASINPDLFQWVIENLLKNATEAIENKRGKVFIDLSCKAQSHINISVTDTGKGMTAKQRRQIFFPGFTTKKRGWGLGLSLCKRIVEDYHDGKIYLKETSPGKGSTFVIELPSYNLFSS